MSNYIGPILAILAAFYLGSLAGKNYTLMKIKSEEVIKKPSAIVFFMKDHKSLWPISPNKEKEFILNNANKINHRLECFK